MSTADKLIADRGRKLSIAQRQVLAAVAAGNVTEEQSYPYTSYDWTLNGKPVTVTTRSLTKLRLVKPADQREPGWPPRSRLQLTDAGRTLLERMGGDQ
jgi:hypothetical protein